jgi:hypothetical protein
LNELLGLSRNLAAEPRALPLRATVPDGLRKGADAAYVVWTEGTLLKRALDEPALGERGTPERTADERAADERAADKQCSIEKRPVPIHSAQCAGEKG